MPDSGDSVKQIEPEVLRPSENVSFQSDKMKVLSQDGKGPKDELKLGVELKRKNWPKINERNHAKMEARYVGDAADSNSSYLELHAWLLNVEQTLPQVNHVLNNTQMSRNMILGGKSNVIFCGIEESFMKVEKQRARAVR